LGVKVHKNGSVPKQTQFLVVLESWTNTETMEMNKQLQVYLKDKLKEKEVKVAGNRSTYCLSLDSCQLLFPKRWHGQRPTDPERVRMIEEMILETEDVPQTISMAYSLDEGLVIYDGLHRWTATKYIKNPNIRVLIEILWDATDENIYEAFRTINLAVSVSEMYKDPELIHAKVAPAIEAYFTNLAIQYPDFVSKKEKYNRPNFKHNDPRHQNVVTELWKDDFDGRVPIEKILQAIDGVNKEYDEQEDSRARLAVEHNPSIRKKCEKHHFWLFAADGLLNRTDIRRYVRNNLIPK
jgi:hypothetical protein